MQFWTSRALSLPVAVLLGAALCGCPNPNTYQTPRTVAPGKIQHSVSLEGYGATVETVRTKDTRETTRQTETVFLPTLPSYQLRVGLGDRVDVGGHLHNLSSLGLDVKVNPLRGVFDLAVDPGVQYFYAGSDEASVHVFYMHAPLMLGLNPTDWFSIVLTPGVTYALVAGRSDVNGVNKAAAVDGLLLRGSLGLQFRASNSFAIHPEVTLMKGLEGPGVVYNLGLGFNFGTLPSYEDLAGPAPGGL